jgi:hypothetical protein
MRHSLLVLLMSHQPHGLILGTGPQLGAIILRAWMSAIVQLASTHGGQVLQRGDPGLFGLAYFQGCFWKRGKGPKGAPILISGE